MGESLRRQLEPVFASLWRSAPLAIVVNRRKNICSLRVSRSNNEAICAPSIELQAFASPPERRAAGGPPRIDDGTVWLWSAPLDRYGIDARSDRQRRCRHQLEFHRAAGRMERGHIANACLARVRDGQRGGLR